MFWLSRKYSYIIKHTRLSEKECLSRVHGLITVHFASRWRSVHSSFAVHIPSINFRFAFTHCLLWERSAFVHCSSLKVSVNYGSLDTVIVFNRFFHIHINHGNFCDLIGDRYASEIQKISEVKQHKDIVNLLLFLWYLYPINGPTFLWKTLLILVLDIKKLRKCLAV